MDFVRDPVGIDLSRRELFASDPTITCDPAGSECVAKGGLPLLLDRAYFELGSAPNIGLYGNHWLYADASGVPYLSWNQTSASVNDSACVGSTKRRPLLQSSTTKASQVLLETSGEDIGKSSWVVDTYAFSDLNTRSSGTPTKLLGDINLGWNESADRLANTAEYIDGSVPEKDLPANSALGPVDVGYTLRPPSASSFNTFEQLALGASFSSRSPVDPSNHKIEVLVSNEWWIDVPEVACG